MKKTLLRKAAMASLFTLMTLTGVSIHNQLLLNNLQVISQKYGRNL